MEEFIDILWKSSLSVAVFYCFYKVLLQNETFFKSIRYFLLFGIFISLLIPFVIITKYVDMSTIMTQIEPTSTDTSLEISNSSINWNTVFLNIYLMVTLLFITRFLFQIFSIVKLIKQGNIRKENTTKYVETTINVSPFSFFNYIVYNPQHFTSGELEQILSHEKNHVKQKHSIDNILATLLTSMQWFNPFAWLYKKEVCQNLEYSADVAVLIKSNKPQSYQQLLLKTAVPNYQIALANNFYNSLLKKRIIMLQQQRSDSKSQWKFAMIIPLLIGFIFAFNVKTIAQQKEATIIHEQAEVFALIIDKTATKENLGNIRSKFKAKGLDVKFKNVKRNDGNIIAISIDAAAKNGKTSASYAAKRDKGIDPIQISFDSEKNSLNIGAVSDHDIHSYTMSDDSNEKIIIRTNDSKDKNTWVTKKGTNTVYVHVNSNDEDGDTEEEIIIEDENGKKIKKEIIKVKKGGSENKFVFISGDDDKNPLILLDGKEISKTEMEAIDTDSIKTINVLKGNKAIEKHGDKAKDGVIVITTKKE